MKDETQTSDPALAARNARKPLSRGAVLRFATDFLTLKAKNLNTVYGDRGRAVRDLSCSIPRNAITAIIGPSGCGKSTLLRAFNRINELIPGTMTTGEVFFHSKNIYAPGVDPVEVRLRIGMVFQKPNPIPKSVHENIAWAARVHRYAGNYDDLVESCLRNAALWDEIKDKLRGNALDREHRCAYRRAESKGGSWHGNQQFRQGSHERRCDDRLNTGFHRRGGGRDSGPPNSRSPQIFGAS